MPWQGRTAPPKRPRPTTPAARRGNPEKQRSKEHDTCKEDHHRRRTGGRTAAGTAPKAAAQCPYTVSPLGRYIAPAIVQGMTATDDGNAVEVWCTDALDGDDWFFTVDNETELKIYSRVNLVIDANGTPDDYSDDKVIDALFCNDCTED